MVSDPFKQSYTFIYLPAPDEEGSLRSQLMLPATLLNTEVALDDNLKGSEMVWMDVK